MLWLSWFIFIFIFAYGIIFFYLSLTKGRREDNWNALNDNNGPRQKFYMNLCRTLNPVPVGEGCDMNAAVCMTKFENNEVSLNVLMVSAAFKVLHMFFLNINLSLTGGS